MLLVGITLIHLETKVAVGSINSSDEPGLLWWNQVFATKNQCEKWVEHKLNKVFLYFLPNFCHLWWFFKVLQHWFGTLHFEKSSKIAIGQLGKKWMKKSLVQFSFNKLLKEGHFQNQKPGFWKPNFTRKKIQNPVHHYLVIIMLPNNLLNAI